ncbi:Uncharacterized protein C21orf63 like protein [Cyphomyrmex costatus]|uniref:Uncharacterized protein C21orf63 like protein n=1 Tax=Cyphomyrmex costatus TaxID=456900 RepID=A0A195C8A4_9HYME|nr:Uncharacterized protein C21orf63 like protein [Cyphomyrmex costatus]
MKRCCPTRGICGRTAFNNTFNYEFRSKVACENEVVNLVCHPGQRVAIFSAAFGRTQYESLQCPQPLGVQEETCMMDFTTETVMQLCHGKRRCTVVANSTTFGRPDPCSPDSKTYLKVVYTCERKVITYLNDKIVRAFTRESVASGDSLSQSLKRIVRKTDITGRAITCSVGNLSGACYTMAYNERRTFFSEEKLFYFARFEVTRYFEHDVAGRYPSENEN